MSKHQELAKIELFANGVVPLNARVSTSEIVLTGIRMWATRSLEYLCVKPPPGLRTLTLQFDPATAGRDVIDGHGATRFTDVLVCLRNACLRANSVAPTLRFRNIPDGAFGPGTRLLSAVPRSVVESTSTLGADWRLSMAAGPGGSACEDLAVVAPRENVESECLARGTSSPTRRLRLDDSVQRITLVNCVRGWDIEVGARLKEIRLHCSDLCTIRGIQPGSRVTVRLIGLVPDCAVTPALITDWLNSLEEEQCRRITLAVPPPKEPEELDELTKACRAHQVLLVAEHAADRLDVNTILLLRTESNVPV